MSVGVRDVWDRVVISLPTTLEGEFIRVSREPTWGFGSYTFLYSTCKPCVFQLFTGRAIIGHDGCLAILFPDHLSFRCWPCSKLPVRMLSDILSALGPVVGLCHSTPRLAELILLFLVAFILGFCCGGIIVGLLISARCQVATARLIYFLIEGADQDLRPRPERPTGSPDRLQRYRA